MSDLISREALKEKLHFLFKWYGQLPCSEEDKCIQRTIKRCMGELDSIPTVDAVEVVRCGDCKYYETELCENQDNHEDWFCADGERKEVTE